jgi:SpoVK/Ycf46/Vps4 family AAA+-type ATPase
MAILNAVLKELPVAEDVHLILLANETNGFSGALVSKICQHAFNLPIRESIKEKKTYSTNNNGFGWTSYCT